MTSFISSLLTPPQWKTPASEKKVVGTHMGKLDVDSRAKRKAKNLRTKQHQPTPGSNGMHMGCYDRGHEKFLRAGGRVPKDLYAKPFGCGHRKHGAPKRQPA